MQNARDKIKTMEGQEVRQNHRPLIAVIVLSILGLGVAGAIIYFTLQVTGVIHIAGSDPTKENLTQEEKAARDTLAEYTKLKDRITALKNGSKTEDYSLVVNLQSYLARMIDEYGKDSEEVLNATLLLSAYYDFMSQYSTARSYLDDRLSVLEDNSSTRSTYIAELYRLANKYGDTDAANHYLEQTNSDINNQPDNEAKAKIAYDSAMQIYLAHINDEHIEDHALLEQMLSYAYQAEELHPTGDTAALIAYIEIQFGDEAKGREYLELAGERDPSNYKIGNGEDDVS